MLPGGICIQALRDRKGEKLRKDLKLMCQSITEKSLQKQGTAPVEEDLKIQGDHTTSETVFSVLIAQIVRNTFLIYF